MRAIKVQLVKRHIIFKCEVKEGNYKIGDFVMVDTKGGIQMGRIVSDPWEIAPPISFKPGYKVLRLATADDLQKKEEEGKKAAEAIKVCKEKIEQLELPMKLVDVSFQPGGQKITFFFVAGSRINFRELVKQLATELHSRVEMRQIGARNEAKMRGGVGCCGRPICCASFLPDFEPVTIRMAKDQGVSLDPAKISGLCGRLLCCKTFLKEIPSVTLDTARNQYIFAAPEKLSGACGRLLCCLRYELPMYEEALKILPPLGSWVETKNGVGRVIEIQVPLLSFKIQYEDERTEVVRAEASGDTEWRVIRAEQ